jgi:sarcosine oxidase gamma subunit
VSHLDFLSPDLASAETAWRSPLERALAHAPDEVEDLSRTAVFDIRGEVTGLVAGNAEVVPLTPERVLVLCPFEVAGELRSRLAGDRRLVIDVSAGWAGLRVRGETLLRRLTDLDLDALPAMGSLAHMQVLVIRDEGDVFRLYFAQEYGDSVAEAVLDAAEGLAG